MRPLPCAAIKSMLVIVLCIFHKFPDEWRRCVSLLPMSPKPINPILAVHLLSVFTCMTLTNLLDVSSFLVYPGGDRTTLTMPSTIAVN
jgi:hypothetical protein